MNADNKNIINLNLKKEEKILAKFGEDYFITNPYIDFSTGISATIILIAFGAFAGYLPAKRAASIKPIEALRDDWYEKIIWQRHLARNFWFNPKK